jgi:hypothetical protein
MLSGPTYTGNATVTSYKAFYHPDYTVGSGVSPDPALDALAGYTADRELATWSPHPAPKALCMYLYKSL